ncbi:MAG: 50S ribosomal protein L21 [Eubacteriales bacterium]|jgi:large subunit ribosomal protein L21|nr:50S ribosomal protein L21 [Eubacteriales bacterium]HBI56105.1 50S ribosomal protein L21 [Bacillota bacterium]MDD3073780.1 50S ribosomal protein L21 [Eubacteriales bacterium]MDD4078099.1 50S ribosomal protein L21 [Eubacteriales bacterium]MDD4768272.1 50S ribosomal protein L21 [Eubacteriales bacterium]
MYAILKNGGKQYRVCEGDVIFLEKIQAQPGETVSFNEVLAVGLEDKLMLGKPYVENASITARIVDHGKAKKVIVFKYKAKKNYRRKQGHRQPFTKVAIEKINLA